MKKVIIILVLLTAIANTSIAHNNTVLNAQSWYNASISKDEYESGLAFIFIVGAVSALVSVGVVEEANKLTYETYNNLFISFLENNPSLLNGPTMENFLIMCSEKGLIAKTNKKLLDMMNILQALNKGTQ